MIVKLRAVGKIFDISNYIDGTVPQQATLDGDFDTAALVLPNMRLGMLPQLDLDRKIPLNSIVEVIDFEDTRQYYVVKADVEVKGELYTHTLTLQDLSYMLQHRPIPDHSKTQPQSTAGIYVGEASKTIGNSTFIVNENNIQEFLINMTTSSVSNDDTIIENRTLKIDGEYRITTTINFDRILGSTPYIYLEDVSIVLKRNGVKIDELPIGVLYSEDLALKYTLTTNYNNVGVGEITTYVTAKRLGAETVNLRINDSFLNIVYTAQLTADTIYMDSVVEKILKLTNVNAPQEILLNVNTKNTLATIKAYDRMFTDQTLYTSLTEIAKYVKAKIHMYMIDSQKWLEFIFKEDLSAREYVEVLYPQVNITGIANDYTSALAIKNDNVVKDDYNIELMSIRGIDGTLQITTDNIGAILKSGIDKPRKIEVRGKEWRMDDNTLLYNVNEWVDITDRVIEKGRYDTLDRLGDYDNRNASSQNNHLYYIRGDNKIYGMSFVGTQYEKLLPTKQNRGLYETIAAAVNTDKQYIDGGMTDDNNMQFRISYYGMGNSNAVVLKDDQSGFEEKMIRKINANAKVSNIDLLGEYIHTKVNSIGGTQRAISGYAMTPEQLPKLGTVSPDGYRVITVTKDSREVGTSGVYFIATLVKDYVYESEYIGIESDRRLYEIDKIEYVTRIDKSLNKVFLDKDVNTGNETSFNIDKLFDKLKNNNITKPPKLANVSFDDKDLTLNVEATATGTTIEWILATEDNYSAGMRKVYNSSLDVTYMQGVAYVNLFGNATQLNVNYYEDYTTEPIVSTLNALPLGHSTLDNNLGTLSYEVDKDSREHIVLSNQLSLLSNHKDIQVYSGLAKYNSLSTNNRYRIVLAVLNYTPNKDDKYIDLGRATEVTNNTYITSEYIEVTLSSTAVSYAWYEEESEELLLVVKNGVIGSNKVYYQGLMERFDRRFESTDFRVYTNVMAGINISDTSVIVSYGSKTFSDIIDLTISDFEIEYIEHLKANLNISITDTSVINSMNSKVFSDYVFVNSNLSIELYQYATMTPNITIQDTSVITNISSVILSDNIYVGASIDRTLVLPIEPIVSVSISIENTYDDDVVNIAITQSSATQLTYAYIVATSQGGTKNGSGIATNGLSNEYVRYNPYGDVQAYVYVTFPAQVVDGYYYKAKTIYAET